MRVDPLQILTKLAAVQNIPTRRVTPPFEGLEEFDYGLRRSAAAVEQAQQTAER